MRTSTGEGFDGAGRSGREASDPGARLADRPARRPLDNAKLRWMAAGTLAFWLLVVYEAGRSLF